MSAVAPFATPYRTTWNPGSSGRLSIAAGPATVGVEAVGLVALRDLPTVLVPDHDEVTRTDPETQTAVDLVDAPDPAWGLHYTQPFRRK